MPERMRFILDGDDRLTPVLNRAGDSSARLHRRLNDDMDGNSRALRGFTQDADGRLRDLRGRYMSVADAQRLLGDGAPDVARRLRDVGSSGAGAASSLGSSGGGLSGGMLAVAAAAGLSLLPALGALVPMLAGGALAAGTLKLGFAGVGDAMEAAGKGKKEYAEALKKLSPEARSFTKELVGMKKEFSGVGKDVQRAMLPGFTRALKDAAPVVKILGKSMTEMGGAFGDAARGVGRLLKDSGFQSDLQANLKLGAGFVRDMTSSMGPFVRSLLDFGAASGPTLKAFSDGIGGLLSKGLPSMFDGLKVGIPGTAQMLDGLFSAVNSVVGGIGRLGGEAGRVLGPLFGETFKIGGDIAAGAMNVLAGALDKLQPLFREITFGLKTIRDVGAIVGPTLKDTALGIAGAFLPIGDSVNNAVGPLQRLNLWVAENKGRILEWSRIFGNAMIDITGAAISAAPVVIEGFKQIATGVLTALDGIISGAAHAFGWIPGIGDKLKTANRQFDDFKGSFISGLDKAQTKASQFAASAAPRLAAGKLKLDINNWQSQIEAAKAKLKTVPPSKQAALKASIADLEAKIRSAKGQLNSLNGRTATTYVQTVFTTKGSKSAVAPAHRAYASGGTPKAGEVAMVGEQGPELVVFGEDARVFDARKTQSMLRGSGFGVRSATSSGVAVAQGLVAGMSGATATVGAAARLMAAAVTAGIREEMQIASPSKKTKALAQDIGRGLIVGLTGSQAKIKSVSADLAKDIKTAFSGKKESGLVRYVDKQTDRLLAVAKKRDAIAAKIAEAKKYASDLTSSARSGAGLANLGLEEGGINAGTIKGGLAGKLAQVRQFTDYITILAKKGLNKGLLRQILNMGPEAGYAYASALVGADKSTFKSINSLQSKLDASTATLGRVGADKLYDSGKNATKGFLAGLASQEKQLEAIMVKIAKSMQKALRKALGIKSPARAMIPDGINTARGVAVGVLQGLPHVDRAMQAVAGRMAGQAAASPVVGRPAAVGSGGVTYYVQVDVHDPMDPVAVGREFQRVLVSLGRHQGTTVVLSPGR
jgi:chorismate mutase